MKTKKFSRKLALNKETLVNLTDTQQSSVKGGAPLTSVDHIHNCYTLCVTTGPCFVFNCAAPDSEDTACDQ